MTGAAAESRAGRVARRACWGGAGGLGGAVPCRRQGGSGSSLLAQRPRGGDGAGPGEDVREELRVSGQKERRVQRPPGLECAW